MSLKSFLGLIVIACGFAPLAGAAVGESDAAPVAAPAQSGEAPADDPGDDPAETPVESATATTDAAPDQPPVDTSDTAAGPVPDEGAGDTEGPVAGPAAEGTPAGTPQSGASAAPDTAEAVEPGAGAEANDGADAADDAAAITVLDQVVPVAEDPAGPAPAGAGDSAAAPGDTPAEDGVDAAPDAAAGPPLEAYENPELSDRERLELAFGRFQELRQEGMLDEAENAAKRAVEMSITVEGPGSNDTAKALTNLATVQYDTKSYDAAKQNYQSAIDIYKTNEDQLSARLINPLRGLGAAQLESGRPDEALQSFRQAVHISHVNEGPHNAEQMPILEALAETQLRMGEVEDAKDTQEMIYALNLRHLDGEKMDMVPPLMRYAAWQRRMGFVLDERATYMRVIRIIEDEQGDEDIALIEPLTKLAESYYYVDTTNPSIQAAAIANGEIYFKRAIKIAEGSPDADWRVEAGTTLALADYYNFRSDVSRARRTYREVWDLLSAEDERLEARHDLLEQVLPLNEDPIPEYVGSASLSDRQQADRDVREGRVVASYDVSSRGRMSRLRIVELEPAVFDDVKDDVIRELRNRIYRPRFVDAEPVDTENLLLTHRFFYLQSDLDQRVAASNGSDDGQDDSP